MASRSYVLKLGQGLFRTETRISSPEAFVFESITGLLYFAITAAAGLITFGVTREFVRQRLRFVDAARHPVVPWLAAFGVLLVMLPVAALLPLITATTAGVAGAAAGLGTASGVKALKSGQ
jgi:hypothetical protein